MKRTAAAVLMAFLLALPLSLKTTEQVLEPWTYSENFEEGLLGAWASYPHWQDTAYDPNIRPNRMVPGDPNLSLEERVTPYSHVDNYCGVVAVEVERLPSEISVRVPEQLRKELLRALRLLGIEGVAPPAPVERNRHVRPPQVWGQRTDRGCRGSSVAAGL